MLIGSLSLVLTSYIMAKETTGAEEETNDAATLPLQLLLRSLAAKDTKRYSSIISLKKERWLEKRYLHHWFALFGDGKETKNIRT